MIVLLKISRFIKVSFQRLRLDFCLVLAHQSGPEFKYLDAKTTMMVHSSRISTKMYVLNIVIKYRLVLFSNA